MARPIEFDRKEALEAGMNVFWGHGYAAASLDQLIRAMGLSKSSFYQAFGSKRDLLLAAIDHYTDLQIEALDRLWQGRGFVEGLRLLFRSVADDNCGGHGCLLVNSATEIAPHDPAIGERVRLGLERSIGAFEARIRLAQQAGELPQNHDAHDLAAYLASSLAGLRVFAKAGLSPASLKRIEEEILAHLK